MMRYLRVLWGLFRALTCTPRQFWAMWWALRETGKEIERIRDKEGAPPVVQVHHRVETDGGKSTGTDNP